MHGPDFNLSDRDFGNPVRLRLESKTNEDYIRGRFWCRSSPSYICGRFMESSGQKKTPFSLKLLVSSLKA